MDTDKAPACYVHSGERLHLIRGGGYLHSDGTYYPSGVVCTMERGSGFSVLMSEDVQDSLPDMQGDKMEPTPSHASPPAESPEGVPAEDGEDAPAPAVHHPSAHHGSTHHQPPVDLQPIVEGGEEDGGLGQVLGLGSMLQDNPWAPVVIVVLAIVAVLGGRQAWKFYSDRAAQNHELEMKKLDIQARVQGLDGAQPPPCQARDIEHEQKMNKINERIEEDEKRIGALERRLATFSGPDNDAMEDMEKRLKKAERTIAALKREEN